MRRMYASLLVLVLGVVHLAPLAVLVQFHMDRTHIEQELCVQREVMAGMRTCHGECQLSKRFRALEQRADSDFPVERIESRFEPKVPLMEDHLWFPNGPFEVRRPELVLLPLQRTVPAAEPVPWQLA